MQIKPFELERYFAKYEFTTPYLLSCSDCETFSINDILKLENNASDEFNNLLLGYTESLGNITLRTEIANIYQNISAENILVHVGAQEAIFNLMHSILTSDDHIIVHYPCYQSLHEVARSIGCKITKWQTSEESEWKLDINFLKKNLQKNTKLVIINCPHNPTGYLLDNQTFHELVNLSHIHGFIIFSDEVYRLLEYDHQSRLPALCDLDERGISLGVMSKSFGLAGLRLGWLATNNKNILEKLISFKDYTTICNSAPSEFLATIALKNKDYIVSRNRKIVVDNLKLLKKFIEKYNSYFTWCEPQAGPIAFPTLKNADVNSFCDNLREQKGVLLAPGNLFQDDSNNFRIGFGRSNFQQCLTKFEEFLQIT